MLKICPWLCCIIRGRNSFVKRKGAIRFVFNVISLSWYDPSATLRPRESPALLTSNVNQKISFICKVSRKRTYSYRGLLDVQLLYVSGCISSQSQKNQTNRIDSTWWGDYLTGQLCFLLFIERKKNRNLDVPMLYVGLMISITTTRTPSAASCWTTLPPMPPLPPVTTTISFFQSQSLSVTQLLWLPLLRKSLIHSTSPMMLP